MSIESELRSRAASVACQIGTQHVNAQSTEGPTTVDVDTLACAFTRVQYASMSSHGASANVPEMTKNGFGHCEA